MQLPASTVLSSQRERLSVELDRMRRNHVLCDVVIICDTTEFYAHRNVLSASSPYFYAQFNAEAKDVQVEAKENVLIASPENNREARTTVHNVVTALVNTRNIVEKKVANRPPTTQLDTNVTTATTTASSTAASSATQVTSATLTSVTTTTTASTASSTDSVAANAMKLLAGLKKEIVAEVNTVEKKETENKKIDIVSLLTTTKKITPTNETSKQSDTQAPKADTKATVKNPDPVQNPNSVKNPIPQQNPGSRQNPTLRQTPAAQKTQISAQQNMLAQTDSSNRSTSKKINNPILPPTSKLPDDKSQAIEIFEMSEIPPNIMDHILTFVYTGHVTISHGELQMVLDASHKFRLTELYNFCRETLVARLTLDNYEHCWDLSDLYRDPMLQSQVAQFAARNFRKLQRSPQFMHLPVERLAAIVGSDRLSVASHDEVLDAVLSWVKHDRLMRQRVFADVLPHIRFDLLSTDYMRSLQSEPIVMSSLELLQSLTKSVVNRSLAPGGGQNRSKPVLGNVNNTGGRSFGIVETIGLSSEDDSPAADRVFRGGGQVTTFGGRDEPVMVVVGQDKDDSVIIQYLVLRTREWSSPVRATVQKKFTSVSTLKDEVYLIGGKVDLKPSSTVHVYDLLTRRLRPLRSMHLPRCGMGVAELDGLIYAIGGYNKGGWIRDVECYDPLSNRWSFVSPLSEGREGVTVAGVHGKLVAVGGVPVPTTELYDPLTDQWTKVARMRHARVYHGVGVVGNSLFVVGGFGHQPDRVQCYDVIKDSWQVVATRAPAQCKDTWCAAVSWEGHVIVINSDGLVWDYDTVQETWTKLPASFSLIGGYISDFISATLVSL